VGDAPLGLRHLSPEARQRLRALLAEQRFFSLQQEYGECVIDGRELRISATLNGRRHDVLLCDLPSKGRTGPDVRALLRVWYGALQVLADSVRVENNDARILENKP